MKQMTLLFRSAVIVSSLLVLNACSNYGRIDDYSLGYTPGTDGYYAKVVSIVDAKTEANMKTAYRSSNDARAVYANKPLRTVLGCGRRSGGIGSILSTRDLLVFLGKDAHMSYVPLMLDSAAGQGSTCVILVNIQEADGRYRVQEFERQRVDSVEGREIYNYVPLKAAEKPKP